MSFNATSKASQSALLAQQNRSTSLPVLDIELAMADPGSWHSPLPGSKMGLTRIASKGVGSRVSTLQIAYNDLSYSIRLKDSKASEPLKMIIKGVSGVIQPGRLTAVMGASGAGKTTFLNVLAGFAKGDVLVGGSVRVNGEAMDPEHMRRISGFVHQEDIIMETMTVHEALNMAALLKLPPGMSKEAKMTRALEVSAELNLCKALNNFIGNSMLKGISGGEKRRLSMGMEMITNPLALFLDEPTSGLDTHTAYKVMSILQEVARRQSHTIVATIHQPSSDIFHLFDDLLVLADGQVMYHGVASELMGYFTGLGYQCPQFTNPADFLFMEVLNHGAMLQSTHCESARLGALSKFASRREGVADVDWDYTASLKFCETDAAMSASFDDLAAAGVKATEEQRVRGLLEAWSGSPENAVMMGAFVDGSLAANGVGEGAVQQCASLLTQFWLLSARAARNQWRNPLIVKGKLIQTIVLSLIVGLIYLQLDTSLNGIQNREGSLFFLIVQGLFGSVMMPLTIFGTEKAVLKREFESKLYGLPAFYWSRWLVELPTHVVFPIISACMVYWMIGYQALVAKFFWFTLASVLIDNAGAALGMFVTCLFDDMGMAMTVMPVCVLPLMIFSGFFINSKDIPVYLRWIQYISPMRYAYFAVAENEFDGLVFHCTAVQPCPPNYNGEEVVRQLGINHTVSQNLAILFAMWCALLAMAYLALWNAIRRMGK